MVQGNYIGTDVTGTTNLGNVGKGIEVTGSSTNIAIGGNEPATKNVVSANGGHGVHLNGSDVSGVATKGNYVGTNADGTAA